MSVAIATVPISPIYGDDRANGARSRATLVILVVIAALASLVSYRSLAQNPLLEPAPFAEPIHNVTLAVEGIRAIPGLTAATAHGAAVSRNGSDIIVTDSAGGISKLSLPLARNSDPTVIDGLAVFPTSWGAVTVQPVSDTVGGGNRILYTLNGPQAPTTLPMDFDVPVNGRLTMQADGSVAVTNPDNSIASTIAPPWAKDATGQNIPTWYEANGSTVIQHVNTSHVAAWPVTVDPWKLRWPKWSWSAIRCVAGAGLSVGAVLLSGGTVAPWAIAALAAAGCIVAIP
jgi:hypothetical protein